MDKQGRENWTRPIHEERRERPHRAAQSRPGPFALRGSLPPRAAGNRSPCFGRAERFCRTDCMHLCMQLIDNPK
jgi:hypothetical protein